MMKILPFATAVLSLVVALIGLVKARPDLGMPSISRVDSEFEELKKLESHLGRDTEAAIRLRRKLLTSKAMEALYRRNYVQQGMTTTIRQRLGFGCFSASLVGAEIGIAIVLGVLFFSHPQKDDSALSFRLYLAFSAVLLIAALTAAAGNWIYARITLNRQFRLDMLERSHNMEDETDTSLQDAMNGSFERLVEYEKRRFMWKLACFFEWLLIAFIPCVYPFILNKWIPVQPVMDLFGLDMDRLGGIMACIYLVSLFFSLITAIFVLLFPPKDENKRTKPMERHDRDDSNDGNTELPTGGQTGRRSQTTTADTSHTDEDRPASHSTQVRTWGAYIGVYHR